MAKQDTQIVLAEQYPIIGSTQNVLEVIRDNMGDDPVSAIDLDRIKIPAGGGSAWAVPSLDGEEMVKSLECIPIHWKSPRVYWRAKYGEGEMTPPDCASDDGKTGFGLPGGPCADCPLNVWGSDPGGGRRKACKEMRQLFVMLPGNILPVAITLAPTSIQNIRTFNLRLANKGVKFWQIVMALSLEKQQQKGGAGLVYSVAVPSFVKMLEPDEIASIGAYRDQIIPILDGARTNQEDYAQASDTSEFK